MFCYPYRTFSLGALPLLLMAAHSFLCSFQQAVWQVRSQ
jgi:hypothetical protein